MAITTKHTVTNTKAKFQYWYNGSNKGIRDNVSSSTSEDLDAMRQLAYSSYTSNYYTTYMPLNNDSSSNNLGSISNINKTYKPTKITITCTRNGDHGSHGSDRVARFGVITSAKLDGASGLTKSWDVTIKPVGSGSQTYTLTSNATDAVTFVNTIAGGGYFTLGCNAKPSSSSSPMAMTNYMGINYSGFSVNITWELRNTPCTAPSTINFTSYVKPGGELTISWSGAKNGEGDSKIASYDVYYKIGSAPTTNSGGYDGYQNKNVDDGDTFGSCTFIIPDDAKRGDTFYAMIRARSTETTTSTSYNSSYVTKSGGKVNTLPTLTVSASKTKVKSTGENVTFTIKVTDEKTKKYKWYTSSSSTKTTGTDESLVKEIKNTITYFFIPYDDIEEGPTEPVTITVNSKPVVTAFNMKGHSSYKYIQDGFTNNDNFYGGVNFSVTGSDANSDSITYTWELGKATIGSTNYSWSTISGVTGNTLNKDLTSLLQRNQQYKIRVTPSDSMESGATVTSSNIFYMAPWPTKGNIYNNYNENLNGVSRSDVDSNRFFDKICCALAKDSSISNISLSCAGLTLSSKSTLANYKETGYYCADVSDTPKDSNTQYTFNLTLTSVTGQSTILEYSIYSPPKLFSNSSKVDGYYYPYSQKEISMGTPTITLNLACAKSYTNNKNNVKNGLKVYLKSGETKAEVKCDIETSSTSNLYYIYLPKWGDGYLKNVLKLNELNIVDIYLTLTDAFGNLHECTIDDGLQLNFFEDLQGFKFEVVGDNFKEKDTLNFSYEFKSYNYIRCTFLTYICRSDNPNLTEADLKNLKHIKEENADYWWEPYQDNNYTFSKDYGSINSLGVLASYGDNDDISFTVDEISQSKYLYFKIILRYSNYQPSSDTFNTTYKETVYYYGASKNINSLRLEEISLNNLETSLSFSETNQAITLNFISCTDCGSGNISIEDDEDTNYSKSLNKLEIGLLVESNGSKQYLQSDNENAGYYKFGSTFESLKTIYNTSGQLNAINNYLNGKSSETFILKDTDWDYQNCQIIIKNYLTNSLFKETTTNIITIYNITPTVSYRKNYLGINNRNPVSDSVLSINNSFGRDYIYLNSIKDGASHIAKINLSSGEIEGFSINASGGTW